ncbi:SpoIIIAH-like family protein [Clostridiaceae bacterium]|nr:SpoIIIAH-like family protein [Clostridiaceae bacterium]
MKMKRLFRRNQIIITTLAIMIAAAGYLNYSGKKEVAGGEVYEAGAMEISDEDILAENQMVSGGAQLTQDAANSGTYGEQAEDASADGGGYTEIASLDDPQEGDAALTGSEGEGSAVMDNPGEAVLTGGTSVTEYIANVQLSREQIRAKSKETLNEIINNESVDAASREAAVQSMMNLTAIAEKENAAETLLMAKGFADPVVSITDGKVDVVINASSITDPQRAQIEDIVKRKTETGAENIVITLLNLQE